MLECGVEHGGVGGDEVLRLVRGKNAYVEVCPLLLEEGGHHALELLPQLLLVFAFEGCEQCERVIAKYES